MSKVVYYKDLFGGNDKQHITSEETDKDEDIVVTYEIRRNSGRYPFKKKEAVERKD